MTGSRHGTRVLAWGAAVAVMFSGLTMAAPGTAFAAGPSAPTFGTLSPNSVGTAHKDVELTWAPVSGATSYDIQILNDDDPDLAVVLAGSSPIARWTPPVQLPDAQYRWRVRTTTAAGTSGWSAMATLTRGWEQAVTGLTAVNGTVPTLSWNALPDASFYEVEINRRSFRSPQYDRKHSFVCWTAENTYTPYGVSVTSTAFATAPGNMNACALAAASPSVGDPMSDLIDGDTYYWRVRGRDGTVDPTTTPFTDPGAPCLHPWLDSGITVANDGSGGTGVTVPIGETAPDTVGAPDCSDWSAESTFVPTRTSWNPGPAAAPTGLVASPLASGSTSVVTGDPTFSWDPVPDAVFYRLYVSRDRQIGSLDLAASTQATQLTPAAGLGLTSTTQYWAVQACSVTALNDTNGTDDNQIDCGDISAITPISQVTTNPAAPQSLSAQNGYLLATWTTGLADRAPAKAYDVALRNVETGDESVVRTDRVASNINSGTSTLVLPSAGLAEGGYAFRVRPVAEYDRYTSWSGLSGTAVVDKAAPTVRLASAAGFGERTPVLLTFSEPVTNVSSSTLGVTMSTGSHVPGSVSFVSGNTWKFTPSSAWVIGSYLRPWTTSVTDRADKVATVVGYSVRATTTADSNGSALHWVSGDSSWSTHSASDAYGHSYRSTVDKAATSKRAAATAKAYGSKVTVGYCKSPTSGTLRVYVDGTLKTTISQYRSWTGCGSTTTVSGLSTGLHTVLLQAVASGSRGTVTVDRLVVS